MTYDFVLTKDYNTLVDSINYGKEERVLYTLSQYSSRFLEKINRDYYSTNIYGIE
ncbi:hypothetical protein HCQ94_03290 [Actinomyces sp. zg-332]|uniref:hypothetical protein n=1 Tax=Actinomyces sp. zg-332 TaxID=2708340 RepID=UPI001422A5E7|nr:hypothetical protein [Actinomyces sp. zg-332]QPK93631.1 hypothetical protein HCQ94_03290 [Actinomyces sp. zg-332]